MPRIVIENLGEKSFVTDDPDKSLLRHFHDEGIDWMHACGGKGRCTTCKVIVCTGSEHLTPTTPAEERYRAMGALRNNERLSCQVRITGDVRVRVPSSGKLAHIKYSDDL